MDARTNLIYTITIRVQPKRHGIFTMAEAHQTEYTSYIYNKRTYDDMILTPPNIMLKRNHVDIHKDK